jgi:hypothetical protein
MVIEISAPVFEARLAVEAAIMEAGRLRRLGDRL